MASARPINPVTRRPEDFFFEADETKPDMGDAEFVDGRVRVMMDEVRKLIFDGPGNPREKIEPLVERYAKEFSPANPDYIQTMTVEALDAFLKARGAGTDDTTPGDPVRAMLATQIRQFVEICYALHEGRIGDEQAQFNIDATIEDTVSLLRGLDNPAD